MCVKKIIFFCLTGLVVSKSYGDPLPANLSPSLFGSDTKQTECQIIMNNGGQYDLGRISAGLIQSNKESELTRQKSTWTISCSQETTLAVRALDNRGDTSTHTHSWQFGLGSINGSGKIGYYEALLSHPQVDGRDVEFLQEGVSSPQSSARLGNYSLSWAARNTNTPLHGKTFTAEVEIVPVLASLHAMQGAVTDTSNLDGLATLYFSVGS